MPALMKCVTFGGIIQNYGRSCESSRLSHLLNLHPEIAFLTLKNALRKKMQTMKKRKKYQHRDKPRMCDHCVYIGEGDFICDKGPGEPVIVVEDWVPNEDAGRCRRGK